MFLHEKQSVSTECVDLLSLKMNVINIKMKCHLNHESRRRRRRAFVPASKLLFPLYFFFLPFDDHDDDDANITSHVRIHTLGAKGMLKVI